MTLPQTNRQALLAIGAHGLLAGIALAEGRLAEGAAELVLTGLAARAAWRKAPAANPTRAPDPAGEKAKDA